MNENTGEVRFEGPPVHVLLTSFYSLVGFALSQWAEVESELADFYCALVCADGSPVEGALTTWTTLTDVSTKINVTRKVMNQVLGDNRFNDFRADCKRKFTRIGTLSETRNKIAHGKVTYFPAVEITVFLPYYNRTAWWREEEHRIRGLSGGTLFEHERWTRDDLQQKVNSLEEALNLAVEVKQNLAKIFLDPEHREFLAKKPRMILNLADR